MSGDNLYTRTFVFSRAQRDEIFEIEKKAGNRTPKLGQVIVNGVPHQYTEILPPGRDSRYSDARILIKGDMRKIKFKTREDLE
jgi:hypothetical protein